MAQGPSQKACSSLIAQTPNPMTLRVGSLFAGIGGLDLAVETALDATVAWQVEIDPYCAEVLTRHWPHTSRYGDISTVDWTAVAPVDFLCGGFPCQDISNAGRRAGIDGPRSGLWREYVRAVRELRPRYAFVENPSALLGRGMGRVVGDLAALRYDAVWDCVPACAVGAAHHRDRLFILATAADPSGARRRQVPRRASCDEGPLGERAEDDHQPGGAGPRRAAAAAAAHTEGLSRQVQAAAAQRPRRSAGRAGLSAADATGQGRDVAGATRPLDPAYERPGARPGRCGGPSRWGDYAAAVARWETVCGRPAPSATVPGRYGQPTLSADFVEWLMGFPAGWTHGRGSARKRALGNAVVPQAAAAAVWLLMPVEAST